MSILARHFLTTLLLLPSIAIGQEGRLPDGPNQSPLMPKAEGHFELGKKYTRGGSYQEALGEFLQAKRMFPDDARFVNACGAVYLASGKVELSRPLFERAISLDPTYFAAKSNLAKYWIKKEDYVKAIAWFKEADKLKPNDSGNLNNLGTAYSRSGCDNEALHCYNRSIELDPKNTLALCNRAVAWHRRAEFPKVITDCKSALNINPNCHEATRLLIALYIEQGDFQSALSILDGLLASNPNSLSVLSLRCTATRMAGLHDESMRSAEKLIELAPNSAVGYNHRAAILATYGASAGDRLLADCNRAIELDPNSASAYTIRAVYWVTKDDFERAFLDCTKSISLDASQDGVYHLRALVNIRMGRVDDAIPDSMKALSLAKDKRVYLVHLGTMLAMKKQDAEAMRYLNRAIAIDPQYVPAYIERATVRFRSLDYLEASQDLTKALQLNPNDAELLFRRGLAWERMDKNELALRDYLLAIQLDPKKVPAMEGRVRVLFKTHQTQQARTESEYILKVYPTNATAQDIHSKLKLAGQILR